MPDNSSLPSPSQENRFVYVGTFTAPHTAPGGLAPSTAEGIYICCMTDTGTLTPFHVVEAENPSYLTLHPNRTFLYSVNELGEDENGSPLGRVSAYRIDPSTGSLTFLNTQKTNGTWPCHCSVHPSGKYLMAANYGSGSFAVFEIHKDGSLSEMCFRANPGLHMQGHDAGRQEGPHAHMIASDPHRLRVFGVDLGLDRVWSWKLDHETGSLETSDLPFIPTASGHGPRHMTFDPEGRKAYLLNELSSSIDVFDCDLKRGSFLWRQTASTLPADTAFKRAVSDPINPGKVPDGTNTAAAISIHPTGKWLYASNRGMNSIVIYSIDQQTGQLSVLDWVSTGGEIPRTMEIDPTGRFLCVGNQNSGTVAVFKIDQSNGMLCGPECLSNIPTPTAILFGAKKKQEI
ncbi:lactonase family protein [Labrenzia sp. PHM005]|uniref:lactonase family protein n=1 Tax=Labrenzia sp. PHM005 TaxID=2590016 RepID=UPI00113FD40A|nr:lactonase family protein [Labrenzia sp. PHM005]QDG75403.1 lactonase family protein [Labrenzia sp. PHM005]